MHQFRTYVHAKGIQNEHLRNGKNDGHAEHARKELMSMWSGCALVSECTHQLLTRMLKIRLSISVRNFVALNEPLIVFYLTLGHL
jgi:hypothetical protein